MAGSVDYFLKLEGLPGESTDSKHKGEIELLSWSFGATQSHTIGSATGGAGAGKVKFEPLHFASHVSKVTPKLFLLCANGKHIPTATLVCRKAGGDQQEYLKIDFKGLIVSSITQGHSPEQNFPVEHVELAFTQMKATYQEQKPDGSAGGSVVGGWDLSQNKEAS